MRIHERIAAIIKDLDEYGSEVVARAETHGSAVRARRDLDDTVGYLRKAQETVRRLNA